MSLWPLKLVFSNGSLQVPGPGKHALLVREDDEVIEGLVDDVLILARGVLGAGAVGWMPSNGGLLSNLPAWENVLLSTQWHAPASLQALEKRVHGWCIQLGYDTTALRALLARQPAYLDDDERRLVGWLRQLLSRPKLIVLRADALPEGGFGKALQALLADELAGTAFLVIDEVAPEGFEPLSPNENGMNTP